MWGRGRFSPWAQDGAPSFPSRRVVAAEQNRNQIRPAQALQDIDNKWFLVPPTEFEPVTAACGEQRSIQRATGASVTRGHAPAELAQTSQSG